jgi:transposase-like protein
MEERLRFIGRLLDGESMSDVCREFGISRTGAPHDAAICA